MFGKKADDNNNPSNNNDNFWVIQNLRFYTGQIPSAPDGDLIDVIHKTWWDNYELLEKHDGYIQWLFPTMEQSSNSLAQPLQRAEADEIKATPEAMDRFLKSYKMMLSFYGMKLSTEMLGVIEREDNWQGRFRHLNNSPREYERITRILKSLGLLGFEFLKKPFIEFMIHEAMKTKELENVLPSCRDIWIHTLANTADQRVLLQTCELFPRMGEVADEASRTIWRWSAIKEWGKDKTS